MLEITKAKYVSDYRLMLWFNDSTVRVVDFKPLLDGEIYTPLEDITYFKQFKIDCGTVSWKNGADFAPEFLIKKGKSFKDSIAAQYQILASPEICSFEGIKVYMNYNDHNPPHFHAKFGDKNVLVNINSCQIEDGTLPKVKALKVLTWAAKNKKALSKNWKLAKNKKPLEQIPPPAKEKKSNKK